MQVAKEQNTEVHNTLEITKDQAEEFFKGVDILFPSKENSNALILTFQGTPLGFAQIKEGRLLNYLPKTFRGTTII